MEAALLFPLILLSIVCLLFFGVFSYQNVYVRQAAEVAAERQLSYGITAIKIPAPVIMD
ncbi:hypothetical protein ABNF65_20625 [Paenibacillus larvae]